MRTVVWFRGKDLRLTDHEPLLQATARGNVIPLFVLDPYFFAPAAAQRLPHRMQFLLDSVLALQNNLAAKGTRLVVAHGPSVEIVPYLANLWRADRVLAHRWSEPFGRVRDAKIASSLGERFQLFEGETLAAPNTVLTGDGRPFSVYTPFAKAFRRSVTVTAPHVAPKRLPPLPEGVAEFGPFGDIVGGEHIPTLEMLGLMRNSRLQEGGERAARKRLETFVRDRLAQYDSHRDRLDIDGTSRLSADLKFGTLSVREVWNTVSNASDARATAREKYSNELLWREFAHHCLWHRPGLMRHPFRAEFKDFPWRLGTGSDWDAWTSGHTGYPVVDAAARQLMEEGFVHNRARMIAASFLTKHLLIHYKAGEAHYLQYLTDGDWAQNNAGWQWSAGCGCDAQPYFRVFNPMTQGEKFDPDGTYVRKYVPELARLDTRFIHKPWMAPNDALRRAGIALGKTYPEPIVDHDLARQRFLALAESRLRKHDAR